MKKKATPLLSVCMIVKNEEQYLERSLKSVQALADEIIIVDTGSQDNTKIIARQYGEVYEYPWQDDFSLVRNFAIAKAKGKWILSLDADEELTVNCQKCLLKYLETYAPAQAVIISFKFINIQQDSDMKITHYKGCLFRNNCGIHYQNPIHEELFFAEQKTSNLRVCADTLTAYHYTALKSMEALEDKLKLYQKIINDTKKQGKNPALYEYYLAHIYSLKKDNELAKRTYLMALTSFQSEKREIAHNPAYFNCLRNMIITLIRLKNYTEALEYVNEFRKFKPNFIDPLYYQAYVARYLNHYEEARSLYEKTLELAQKEDPTLFELNLNSFGESLLPLVFYELSQVYMVLGQEEIAFKLLNEGQKEYPTHPQINTGFLQYHVMTGNLDKALPFYYLLNSNIETFQKIEDSNILCLGSKHQEYKARLISFLRDFCHTNKPESENLLFQKKIKDYSIIS